jgi:hypothetical protein
METANPRNDTFLRFTWRVTAAHMATYMAAGFVAFNLLDYATLWETEGMAHYRSLDSAWVAAGPGAQIVRGLILSLVLYPFRTVFLGAPGGWLKLWALLVGIGILSTYAAAPGSIEGVLYTKIPVSDLVMGNFEVVGQTLAFSLILVFWTRRPSRWWDIAVGAGAAATLLPQRPLVPRQVRRVASS